MKTKVGVKTITIIATTILILMARFTHSRAFGSDHSSPLIDSEQLGSITIVRVVGNDYPVSEPESLVSSAVVRIQLVELIDITRSTELENNTRNVQIDGEYVYYYGVTNEHGRVEFSNLAQGIWLVTELRSARIDGSLIVSPITQENLFSEFLVGIPLVFNGEITFDVRATPKSPATPAPPPVPTPPASPAPTPTPAPSPNPSSSEPTPNPSSSTPVSTSITKPDIPDAPTRTPNLPQTGVMITTFTSTGVLVTSLAIALASKKRSRKSNRSEE